MLFGRTEAALKGLEKVWSAYLAKRAMWAGVREPFQLHTEEAADRLTTLLSIHLLLDRVLTELIARRLVDPGKLQDLKDTETAVSRVSFSHRIKMAKAARLISDSCATDLKTVNEVRNDFAHFDPKNSEGRVGLLPAISSSDHFEQHMKMGERAFTEINGILIELMVEPPTLIEPGSTAQ